MSLKEELEETQREIVIKVVKVNVLLECSWTGLLSKRHFKMSRACVRVLVILGMMWNLKRGCQAQM